MEHLIGLTTLFIDVLPQSLRIEGMRYFFGAGGVFILIWLLLGDKLKNRRIRKPLPSKLLRKQIKREIQNSVISMCVFAAAFSFVYYVLSQFIGEEVFKLYGDANKYGWTYLILSIVIWTIGIDAYFYWSHRFMHGKKFYRFFHLEHHKSHNPTPFTAYSFAPPEAVMIYLYTAIFSIFIPMHIGAYIAAMVIQILRNAIGHCGYEIFPKGWTRHPILGQFTTVTHHDLHHEKGGYNFGFYFTFWDRVMGTEHPDYHQRFDMVTTKEKVRDTKTRLFIGSKTAQPKLNNTTIPSES